jgi:putative transport protein
VTKIGALGKAVEELDLWRRYGATITRVSRAEIEFTPTARFRFQYGDTVLVVAEEDAIKHVAAELGDSPRQLNEPQIVPVFVGIVLGVILGSIPFSLPGVPTPIKLGLAGGPLLAAILLSRIGRIGPLIWHMPISANLMLRQLGVALFLACVGLRSGDQFVSSVLQGQGLYWMACASLITVVPILIVGVIARSIYRLNFLSLCGLLAGAMTDPPALAYANALGRSEAPSVSYATVYPAVMLLRILSAQVLVLLLVR